MIAGAIRAVVEREFKRFIRQRGRLLSTFVRPLLWLVVIGSGYSALVADSDGISYHQYLLPGIFGMVLLFSTMLSALATVHDREFGPIRMLLIAPVPRAAIVWAKTPLGINPTPLGTFHYIRRRGIQTPMEIPFVKQFAKACDSILQV